MSNSKRNNCVDPVFLLEKYAGDCKDEWKIWHRDTEKAIESDDSRFICRETTENICDYRHIHL